PPARGTGPRINHARAAKRATRLPNILLGWVGADGFPFVIPVHIAETDQRGIILQAPEGLVPLGGRRAGLLAHAFARYTYGQSKRQHTGWLEMEADERRVLYAPHTEAGYYLPWSRFFYRLGAGFVTRRGYRAAQRVGFAPKRAASRRRSLMSPSGTSNLKHNRTGKREPLEDG